MGASEGRGFLQTTRLPFLIPIYPSGVESRTLREMLQRDNVETSISQILVLSISSVKDDQGNSKHCILLSYRILTSFMFIHNSISAFLTVCVYIINTILIFIDKNMFFEFSLVLITYWFPH